MRTGALALARVLPGGHVREVHVVALALAVGVLVLLAEMAAAALLAGEGVAAHELAEFEEVGDAGRLLERLVERVGRAGDAHVGPELLAQRGDLLEGLLEALPVARHPAVTATGCGRGACGNG